MCRSLALSIMPLGFAARYQYAGGWGYETGLAADDGGFRGGLAAGSPSRFVWDTTAAGPGELGRGPGTSEALGSPEGRWAEFAAGSGRPDGFRPPDEMLGLAGVHLALPPLRLLHVGWRWYDPALGRFVQRDPVGLAGGVSMYLYCEAAPDCWADPSGLFPLEQGIIDWLSDHEQLARGFLKYTGGERHVPVIDYGTAHSAVLIVCEVICIGAPPGAAGRIITLTPKALAAARKGWAGRYLIRIRAYIRYDRTSHHGKPAGHWDGALIERLREWLR